MSRTLTDVLTLLERMAPLELAEKWDNAGLLLEPSVARTRPIARLFLCIDLEERVLDEALAARADFIFAYHPPIFRGLKRLRASAPEERLLLRALEAGLPVYSPHTALDAARDGVNDWLARGLDAERGAALVAHESNSAPTEFKLVVFVPRSHVTELRRALVSGLGAGEIGNYAECSYELDGRGSFFANDQASPRVGQRGKLEFVDETRLEMRCPARSLKQVASVIAAHHPYEVPAWDLYPLVRTSNPQLGAGRLIKLAAPISLDDAVVRLKAHLGVKTLRVAASAAHAAGAPITSVALCAGAGDTYRSFLPSSERSSTSLTPSR